MKDQRSGGGHDQDALGQVVTFLVAGVLFVASIGTILLLSRDSGTSPAISDPQTAASLQGKANALASVVLDSPGFGANGQDWAPTNSWGGPSVSADGLGRLGLLDADTGNTLDFTKLQNLRRAPYAPSPTDGYVNYPEARTALGLDGDGLDFHIRAYPTLPSVQQILKTGTRDPNLRVTYIGHYDTQYTYVTLAPPSPSYMLDVGSVTCTVPDTQPQGNPPGSPQNFRLTATVVNGGLSTTQFTALFTYKLGTAAATQNANTFLVGAGLATDVFVDVPATAGVACSPGSTIQVTIQDPLTTTVAFATTLLASGPAATLATRNLWVDTSKPYYTAGVAGLCPDQVRIVVGGSDLTSSDKVSVVVRTEAGAQVWPSSGYYTVNANGGNKASTISPTTCLAAGNYLVYAFLGNNPTASSEHVVERLLVTSSGSATPPPSGYQAPGVVVEGPPTYAATSPVAVEVGYLRTLVDRFCPSFYDSKVATPLSPADWNGDGAVDGSDTWASHCASFASAPSPPRGTQPGDVIPDSKKVMNEELPARLLYADGTPRYDIVNALVVGSKVSQTAMTSAAAKDAVRDWVLGGGTLIVFGSDAQNVNWLEPIFHSAIRSSSGGIGVPDPSHPLLHTSDELDYPLYTNQDRVWTFSGQTAQNAADLFTNVVVQGPDPVTTESNPGAMGDGTVILTTWMPSDVYGGSKDPASTWLEGLKLVNNLLMQGYRDLYLDYGPRLPSGTNVIPAMRTVQVIHPQFPQALELSVIFYVF